VATHLHNSAEQLPEGFANPLIEFLNATRSHVATLNYDRLLYDTMLDNRVLRGYDGALIDGVIDNGFSPEHLERKYDKRFGYYLHLHGSPLFYNRERNIFKFTRAAIATEPDECSSHIVLTHVKHKKSVIAASPILSAYWEYLHFALNESEEVILVGYSGLDIHLNQLLKLQARTQRIRVVEWNGSGHDLAYWQRQLGRVDEVVDLPNILSFTDWN
jgi:hypothetical protein